MTRRRPASVAVVTACLWLGACQTQQPRYDYSAFERSPPRSILVVPPINKSTDLHATYGVLSTATFPLAERGYYVFPVAVVDEMFRQNGLPTAGEMHEVSLDKIREIFGADAVLYPVIEDYGTKYHVLSSDTVVQVSARLVDVRTGTLLWQGGGTLVHGSNSSGGVLGALVGAAMSQVLNSTRDAAHPVARQVNLQMVGAEGHGLPYGPYSPYAGRIP